MTAELLSDGSQSLLIEPARPGPKTRCTFGWQRVPYYDRADGLTRLRLVRRFQDDADGARLQRAIMRYVVGGESRAVLADEIGVSETNFQYALRGKTWVPYTRPLLAALARLGIGQGRGRRRDTHARLLEVIAAQRGLMERALRVGLTDAVKRDMRLLLAAQEAP